ncbi:MAG: hypothetical protein WC802_05560 [Patescibacteria group bacterium]|jgi:hypothetical protein
MSDAHHGAGHAVAKAVKVVQSAGSVALGIAGAFQLLAGAAAFLMAMAVIQTAPAFFSLVGATLLFLVVGGGSYTLWRYVFFKKGMKENEFADPLFAVVGIGAGITCLFILLATSVLTLQNLGVHDTALTYGAPAMTLIIFVALNTKVDSENWKLPRAKA